MKWLKKHKEEIINGVQFFLMLYAMTMGFWFTYIWVLFKCELPVEWWTIGITMMLALLSMGGLCTWIWKGGTDNA